MELSFISGAYFNEQVRPLLERIETEFSVIIFYHIQRTSEGAWLDLDILFPLSRYCYDQLDKVGDEIYERFCAWLSDFEAAIGAPTVFQWWKREHYWRDGPCNSRGQVDVSPSCLL